MESTGHSHNVAPSLEGLPLHEKHQVTKLGGYAAAVRSAAFKRFKDVVLHKNSYTHGKFRYSWAMNSRGLESFLNGIIWDDYLMTMELWIIAEAMKDPTLHLS